MYEQGQHSNNSVNKHSISFEVETNVYR